jgi:hypothetical protein
VNVFSKRWFKVGLALSADDFNWENLSRRAQQKMSASWTFAPVILIQNIITEINNDKVT